MFSVSYSSTVLFAEDLVTIFLSQNNLQWIPPYSMSNYRQQIPTYFAGNIELVVLEFSDTFQYRRLVESSRFLERVLNQIGIIQDFKQKAESMKMATELGILHFCAYAGEVSVFCERNQQYEHRLLLINTIVSVLHCCFSIGSVQSWTHFDNLATGHIMHLYKKLQERAAYFAHKYKAASTSSISSDQVKESISYRPEESTVDLNSSIDNARNTVTSCKESIKSESFISKNMESNLGRNSNFKKVPYGSLSDSKNANSISVTFIQEASTSNTDKFVIGPCITPVETPRFFYPPTLNQQIFPHLSAANYYGCLHPDQLDFLHFRYPDESYTPYLIRNYPYPHKVIKPMFPRKKYKKKSSSTNSRLSQGTVENISNPQSNENNLNTLNVLLKKSTEHCNYLETANELEEVPLSTQKQSSSNSQIIGDESKKIDANTSTIEELKSSSLHVPTQGNVTQSAANSNMTQNVTDNSPSTVHSSDTSTDEFPEPLLSELFLDLNEILNAS